MKNKIISLIISLFLFLFTSQLNAADQAWNLAQEGNKIILIRHSLAPGGGDPAGFKIDDCKTQRNLSKKGINQSKKIGKLFKNNKIFKIQKEVEKSSWFAFSFIIKKRSYKKFKGLIKILENLKIEFRPIISGNFADKYVSKKYFTWC